MSLSLVSCSAPLSNRATTVSRKRHCHSRGINHAASDWGSCRWAQLQGNSHIIRRNSSHAAARRRSGNASVTRAAVTRPGFVDDKNVDYSGPKATLDGDTEWRLQLALVDDAPPAVIKVVFDRDEGYEPPQGVIRVVEDEANLVLPDFVNRWELGEDPDMKSENPMDGGGLWIWAIFSENPFPCMLFSLELDQVHDQAQLTESVLNAIRGHPDAYPASCDSVPHAQGAKRGTVLSEGTITTRTFVDVPADVIGLSRAQIAEKQPAGTIRLQPLDRY